MADDPTTRAERCALHPERAAAQICSRCGNYSCVECLVPGSVPALCTSCDARLGRNRLVSQVPVLGIVMMVHGALVTLLGLSFFLGGGAFIIDFARHPFGATPEGSNDDALGGVVLATFLVMATSHVLPGIFQIWAGWQARAYKSRGLAIAALCTGLLTGLGCYCFITSIAIMIWGLIVLLNEDVTRRFAMPGSAVG